MLLKLTVLLCWAAMATVGDAAAATTNDGK